MDFSASAEAALDFALEFAQKLDASVVVMHAYEVPSLLAADVPGLITAETVDALERSASSALRELVAKKRTPGVQLEGQLKYGDARSVIEAAIPEFGADLVCMGTHGRRGLRHVLLGSVAEHTVRVSPVPVIVVPFDKAKAAPR